MRLSCFLFISLFAAGSEGFEYYSLSASGGVNKVLDAKEFNLGHSLSFNFKSYTDYFYIGGSLGIIGNTYEDPASVESFSQYPLLFAAGTSHPFDGDNLDLRRYYLGAGIGLVSGELSRDFESPGGRILKHYSCFNYGFLIEGGFLFNFLTECLFIGPRAEFRFNSFTFKDEAFSGDRFMRDYKGSGFMIGVDVSYFIGLI